MLVEVDAPLEVEEDGVRRPLTLDDIRGEKGDPGDSATSTPAAVDALGGVLLSSPPDDPAAPVVVEDGDPRNSNARAPTAHTHPTSQVTGLDAALADKADADDVASALATKATAADLTAEATTRAAGDTANGAAAAAAQATADAALPKAGGTMTGALVLAADPATGMQAATRQYVLAQITALINGAPGALDTLKELADQLASDESAVTALTSTVAGKLTAASNLADLVNAATARTNLGLGSAATHAAGDFDTAGAAAAAQAASQPLDSDLTALAALGTTTFGRALLELIDAAAARTAIGTDTPSDTRTPTDASVTAAKVAGSLKPSSSATATDESLRRLGTGSTHAAAGDDSRFPTAGQKNALAGTNGTPGTGNEYVTKQASGAVGGFAPLDSGLLVPSSYTPKATAAARGAARLSVAPADANDPIAAGTNDPRVVAPKGPRYYRTARYYTGAFPATSGSLVLTQNTTYYLPIWIGKQQAFDQIAVGIVTAQSGSAVRLGIYDVNANGDWPGAVLLDAGTVATTTTGAKTITISPTLDCGLRFLGINAQGGTAGVAVNKLLGSLDLPYGLPSGMVTSGSQSVLLSETGVTGAFATANATPTETATTDLPRILLRAA